MTDHCPLCDRPGQTPSEFCAFHDAAHTNLENAYSLWNKSYGGKLTKEEYFAQLEKREETGSGVKSVIQYLRGKGGPA